ncbi:MAG: DNA translocase FtsK [Candidatus Pacebacteria bacterium]|nr:DNA translocase FtsK [Candidatus Paceibacterota bacterium]
MANKKKRRNFFRNLQSETNYTIIAVVFFAISVFLLLSSVGVAGIVGEKIYGGLYFLLGVGYFLLPILGIMLSISFMKSMERNVALPQTIGALLFIISGLGLIDIAFDTRGGIVGNVISYPLVALIDIYAAVIILLSVLIISLLIILDIGIHIQKLLSVGNIFKKKDADEDNTIQINDTEEEYFEEEEEVVDEPKITTPPPVEKIERKSEEIDILSNSNSNKPYTPPPLSLLSTDKGKPGVGDVKANANIIKRTLQNFSIPVEMNEVSIGPSVTRYSLKPAEGVKLSRIVGLQNELALALAAHPVRIEAPIPGTSLVGIEIPNSVKTTVGLATLLSSESFSNLGKPLAIALGKSISGTAHVSSLAKMPHMLIAGATGSGKSVTIHAIITSLLYKNSPDYLRFVMVDPKRVELTLYNKIPHLLTPVITDPKKAILALKWAAKEMERRYDILESEAVRDIGSYHSNVLGPAMKKAKEGQELPEKMPYIVIVIDELADIMQSYPRELEAGIVRLAQMSRAVGIHLILSTQRPSVNVITGLIKANIPARIALQVSSQIDSRTILDGSGAEKLLGAGDMLYLSGEMSKPQRLQSAFISESEVKKVAKYLADSYEDEVPDEIDFTANNDNGSILSQSLEEDDSEDDLYEDAKDLVIRTQKASTSYLQRKLGIGYARAARLIDFLEERGVIGPANGSKPRDVNEKIESSDIPEETLEEDENY